MNVFKFICEYSDMILIVCNACDTWYKQSEKQCVQNASNLKKKVAYWKP